MAEQEKNEMGATPELPDEVAETLTTKTEHESHHTPGTMVLVLLLLVSFIVYYFANWKALADVWPVR